MQGQGGRGEQKVTPGHHWNLGRRIARGYNFNLFTETARCMIASPPMLFNSTLEIVGRPNVDWSCREEYRPSHRIRWVGRDSNPEPTP